MTSKLVKVAVKDNLAKNRANNLSGDINPVIG